MKLSNKVPAVAQATALFHQRMKVAFDAKKSGNKDHPVVEFYLGALDRKLAELRRKLGVAA